eukprot:403331836
MLLNKQSNETSQIIKDQDQQSFQKPDIQTKEELMQKIKEQLMQVCNDPFNSEDFVFENKNFFLNMGFDGLGPNSIYQIKQWFAMLLCIIPKTKFLYSSQSTLTNNIYGEERYHLGYVELGIVILTLLLRIFIVSFRYATTIDSRLQLQYQRVFTQEENNQEFIYGGWKLIGPEQIDMEIKHTMIRNEVENSFFNFKFLMKIDNKYRERFTKYNYYKDNKYSRAFEKIVIKKIIIGVNQNQKNQTIRQQNNSSIIMQDNSLLKPEEPFISFANVPTREDLFTIYSGRLCFREVFLSSSVMSPEISSFIVNAISYIHAVLPLGLTLIDDLYSFDREELKEKYSDPVLWIYWLALVFIVRQLFWVNSYFLFIGIYDMKRRYYQMESIDAMLEPNRFKIKKNFKFYPLINYFDPQSLMSWLDLRMMVLDIGQRFSVRIQLYMSLYLITYGLIGVLQLLWFFEVYEVEVSFSLVYTLSFEVLLFGFILYSYFYAASQVNEISSNQLLRIIEIRSVLERVKLDFDKIILYQLKNTLLNNAFKDAKLYLNFINETYGIEYAKELIEKCIVVIDVIIVRLDKEIQLNPIKIMGIPITNTVIKAIQTSIVSLAFAMINKKLGIFS